MYHWDREQRAALLNEKRRGRAYESGARNVVILALDGGFNPVTSSQLKLDEGIPVPALRDLDSLTCER